MLIDDPLHLLFPEQNTVCSRACINLCIDIGSHTGNKMRSENYGHERSTEDGPGGTTTLVILRFPLGSRLTVIVRMGRAVGVRTVAAQ
jgi:hypothetical protein